jgi:hypothetical protein
MSEAVFEITLPEVDPSSATNHANLASGRSLSNNVRSFSVQYSAHVFVTVESFLRDAIKHSGPVFVSRSGFGLSLMGFTKHANC